MGSFDHTVRSVRWRRVHWGGSRGTEEAAAVVNQRRLARHQRKRGLAPVVPDRVDFPVEDRSGMRPDRSRAVTPGQAGVAGRGWDPEAGGLQSEGAGFPP